MDIDAIIQTVTAFTQDNVLVSIVIGLFIFFLLLRHPKTLLLVIVLIALAFGVAELFEQLRGKARI